MVGNTAAGKTTFSRRLARQLGVPHVELDALQFEPGWTVVPDDVLRERVRGALAETPHGWVADGNYATVRDLVWTRADTLVWLELPLRTLLTRLTRRTFARIIGREELWGTGNRESLRAHFASRDSLFLWLVRSHRARRRECRAQLATADHAHLRVVHLRSSAAVERWLTTHARDTAEV